MAAGVTTGIEGSADPSQGGGQICDPDNNTCVCEQFFQGGRIYGHTYTTNGWGTQILPLVLVKTGDKTTISNLNGYYSINKLELNKTYEIVASKFFYSTENFTVNLTSENPQVEVDFIMTIKKDITSLPDLTEFEHLEQK